MRLNKSRIKLFSLITLVALLASCSFTQLKKINPGNSIKPNDTLHISQVLDVLEAINQSSKSYEIEKKSLHFTSVSDQENIYLLSNQGLLLTFQSTTGETTINQNLKTKKDMMGLDNTPCIFNQNLVSDVFSPRYSIDSVFYDKTTFDKISSHTITFFTEPVLITQDYLYRAGRTFNGGEFGIIAQDITGKQLWTYPVHLSDGSRDYPYFFSDIMEKNGILHVIYADHEKESLKHVVIESFSGKVLIDETLASYSKETGWETFFLEMVGHRVIWEDNIAYIEGQDNKGVYLTKWLMNADLTLQLIWVRYFSEKPFMEDMFPSGSGDVGLTNIDSSTNFCILLPIWQPKKDDKYTFDLHCVDKQTGKSTWIIQNQTIDYDLHFYSINSSILMIREIHNPKQEPNRIFITALNPSSGKTIWDVTLDEPPFDKETMSQSYTTICTQSTYYLFDEIKKELVKINPETGQIIRKKMEFPHPITKAIFNEVGHQLFLLVNTINESGENTFLFQIE